MLNKDAGKGCCTVIINKSGRIFEDDGSWKRTLWSVFHTLAYGPMGEEELSNRIEKRILNGFY